MSSSGGLPFGLVSHVCLNLWACAPVSVLKGVFSHFQFLCQSCSAQRRNCSRLLRGISCTYSLRGYEPLRLSEIQVWI